MADMKLTKTRVRAGVWEGVLAVEGGKPALDVLHLDQKLPGLTLTESFYWDRDDKSREFGERFFKRTGRMPNMVHAGTYSGVMQYLKAIEKALDHNARGKRLRGGSTISQQVAKNLFLWQGRSWLRKGLEAWYTLLIEAMWPKTRILEVYVNVAEFGDGIYGAQAAARSYWDKDASALTAEQSARLAAVLPAPRRYSAVRPGPYVQRRAAWIQRQMRQLGGREHLDELD